tara:strand:+ start:2710 stop:2997 length:288 start_codon:yes stop_codon:yes gene_type:complete
MEKLSEDCLIEIYKYLDILSFEIIYLRTTSKFHNKFMRKKIIKKINKYTFLENESFFQKSVRSHIFQKELKKRMKITENQYERDNLMMLIEGNWI